MAVGLKSRRHRPLRTITVSRRNILFLPLAAGAVSLGAALPAQTSGPEAAIAVTARVLPQARLQYLAAPPPVDITAADITRGYVEAPAAMQLHIQSNSRSGYALDLLPRSEWFTAVTVRGGGATARFGSSGGTLVQRWPASGSDRLTLGFRFELAADVLPGRYPLPLLAQVRPLESN